MSLNTERVNAVRYTDTRSAATLAERWPDYASRPERLAVLPSECPACGVRARWTHYRLIPGAPAVGCGKCGHVEYVSEAAYLAAQAEAQGGLPKAAAGEITRNFNKRRRY